MRNNLNIIIKENKAIFFLAGKSANSTVKAALRQMVSGTTRPVHSGWETIDPCKAMKKEDYLKIAVVRNPWSRFVSCYYQKIVGPKPAQLTRMKHISKGMSFDAFAKAVSRLPSNAEQHVRPQINSMMCKGELVPDWVIKLENIDTEWKKLQEIIPVPDLVPRNTTDHPHYRECYTEETRRIIGRRFKDDVEILGYQF
jgi:hypothetical protein